MNQFMRANALKSTVGNLVANTVIPTLLLRTEPFVRLKGLAPNLLSVLLPAVFASALMTTLITFGTMTAARKSGQLAVALPPETKWFAEALRQGVYLGLLFAVPTLALLLGAQALLDNRVFSCRSIIVASAVVGTSVGLHVSVLATRRAAQLGRATGVRG
jgi:hypothetical protein